MTRSVNRNVAALEAEVFDVLVVGGGVLGAWTAREAVLQGWKTALIEAGDFASGASWNSLKIVHGGFRHLQRLDVRSMRESIRERSHLLRAAPHLVHPLPVLVPAFSSGLQRRSLLEIASRCNDLVSWDRNQGLEPDRRLPSTRVLSRTECLDRLPISGGDDVSGGIVFHDAQMYAAERLVVEIIRDAADRGAIAANYVECRARRVDTDSVQRIVARDRQTEEELKIRTRCVVNATGASAIDLAEKLTGQRLQLDIRYSVALNVVLDSMDHETAFTLPASRANPGTRVDVGSRQLLFVPWRGHTLVGTGHYRFSGEPRAGYRVGEEQIEQFLEEIGSALPDGSPSPDDVRLVHSGLLPEVANDHAGIQLLSHGRVIHHDRTGHPGIFTVINVKFTTSRALAEQILRRAARVLGRPYRDPESVPPLASAPDSTVTSLIDRTVREAEDVTDSDVAEHLARTYGARSREVLALGSSLKGGLNRLSPAAPVVRAQLSHAFEHEMAQTLEDTLQRRTELGPRGLVTDEVVRAARSFLSEQRFDLADE